MRSFKNQRGVAVIEIILILLVLGVLAFVGWNYYQAKYKATPNKQSKQSNQNGSKKTVSEYEGWKTYTSVDEGLSFKYPSDWSLKKDPKIVDEDGKKYEKVTLTGPNNFQVKYVLQNLDGIGGACPECGIFETAELAIPNYYVEKVHLLIHGPDNAGQMASTVGLEGDPAGDNYTPAVGEGFSFYFTTSKLGGAYKWQMLGSYYNANNTATSSAYNTFKAKPEVIIAKKIFKSVTY